MSAAQVAWPEDALDCTGEPEVEEDCEVCEGSGLVCPLCAGPVRLVSSSWTGDDITWPSCVECAWEGTP